MILNYCRQCNGTGKIFIRPNRKKIPFIDCDICQGTGECDHNILWAMQAEIIKKWRVGNDLTLRECARRYAIDASNLSKMEKGFMQPDYYLLKLACDEVLKWKLKMRI